jgi:hypothetical protein
MTTADNWVGGSGNWSVAANWSAGVPGASSAVTIGNTSSVTVTEDLANATVARLSITNSNALIVGSGNSLAVRGRIVNAGVLIVGDSFLGNGGTLTIGSLTNHGNLEVGENTAGTMTVKGGFSNAGGTIFVSSGSAGNGLLNVAGAAPATLTGTYTLQPNGGTAAVEFGSGTVTSIGDGATNAGVVELVGSTAYFETGATKSNSALTGLTKIATNGSLYVENGAVATTTGSLKNAGNLAVDNIFGGGSSLTLGGSLANTSSVQVGNAHNNAPSTLKVLGALTNTGGTIDVSGGESGVGKSLLNVTGAAPVILAGTYKLLGHAGSAAVEFGSGTVTSIGDGASNAGYLLLSGPNAYLESGATDSNSALAGLRTIASNGTLILEGASVQVNGTLTNTGLVDVTNKATTTGLLNVTGLAPAILTGSYNVVGGAESAAVEFGSGTVAAIGDGAGHAGDLWLSGSNAYFEIGPSNNTSALNGLRTINQNGQLYVQSGVSVTTGTPLTNAGILAVGTDGRGGSLTVGGSLTNTNSIQVGTSNTGPPFSPSTLTVNGTLANAGGTIYVYGISPIVSSGLINVTGAAPATLTGTYNLQAGFSSAAVEFGSGTVTSIGDGASNAGYLLLSGSNAFFETGATSSNSALTGLTTIAGNGQLHLQYGASVTTTGALTNSGSLLVDDSGFGGSSFISNGPSFTNNGNIQIGDAAISKPSTLASAGTLVNTSLGAITLSGGFGGATLNETAISIVNSGIINLNGGASNATLQIGANTTLSGSGTVTMSNIATNLITAASSSLTLTNASTIQGSGTISNMGIVNTGTLLANQSTPMIILPSSAGLNNKGTLNISAGDLMQIGTSAGGALANFSGTTLTGGTYRVSGTLQFGAPGTSLVTNAAHINLTGAGSQIIDFGGANILAGFAANNKGASFTLGAGRNFTTAGNFTNNGTLTIGAGDTFKVNGNLTNFSAGTLTGGIYDVAGVLQFNGAHIATNAANITLSGAGSQVISDTSANALANFAINASAGTFTLAKNQNLTTAGGSFTNAGTFTINQGSTFTVGGSTFNFTQTGGMSTIDGTLTGSSAGTLSLNGGSLFGRGTLGYSVTDAATITPGDSSTKTGILTVNNAYTQSPAGVLDIAIGGVSVGTQYDQLKGKSTASLGGTLNISLISGFTPTIGSTFDIVSANSLSGAFASVKGLSINASEHFAISYTGTGAILTVAAGAAGVAPSYAPHGIHRMGSPAPRRFRPADAAPAPLSLRAGPAGMLSVAGLASPRYPMRLECGVDLLAVLKTGPRRGWKNWLSDPSDPSAVGYVTMTR